MIGQQGNGRTHAKIDPAQRFIAKTATSANPGRYLFIECADSFTAGYLVIATKAYCYFIINYIKQYINLQLRWGFGVLDWTKFGSR